VVVVVAVACGTTTSTTTSNTAVTTSATTTTMMDAEDAYTMDVISNQVLEVMMMKYIVVYLKGTVYSH
jgi:hypothetical protein